MKTEIMNLGVYLDALQGTFSCENLCMAYISKKDH